jgi:hypothetical protein
VSCGSNQAYKMWDTNQGDLGLNIKHDAEQFWARYCTVSREIQDTTKCNGLDIAGISYETPSDSYNDPKLTKWTVKELKKHNLVQSLDKPSHSAGVERLGGTRRRLNKLEVLLKERAAAK